MTVVNPKSISGITSITTASGSDNLLTIHTNDGTERVRVDSTGATKIVTGIVTTLTATTGIVTHFTVDKISLPDSGVGSINIGIGSDLRLYHDGNHSYVQDSGTGNLRIRGDDVEITDYASNNNMARFIEGGAAELYHNNTKRLATTGNGADVFGNGATNNYFKLINTSGTSNASHHMTIDTFNAANSYWNDLKIDASNIQLNTYTGNRATLSNSALTFASGVNIVMASGNGIDFSATSDGSGTTSNELFDDYEEGTFTPAVTSGLSGGTIAYNSRSGKYTKVGNVVTLTFHMNISSASLDSGALKFGGFPFTSVNSTNTAGGMWRIFTTGNISDDVSYKIIGNSTDVQVVSHAGDAVAANSTSINAGNRQFAYWGFYYVS